MNSTTAAAMKPKKVPLAPLSCRACCAVWPSTWNCTPPPAAEVTVFTNCFASGFPILFDWVFQVTFAYATSPFGAIWRALPGAYGDAITETCGVAFSLRNSAFARVRTAGSVTLPVFVAITT